MEWMHRFTWPVCTMQHGSLLRCKMQTYTGRVQMAASKTQRAACATGATCSLHRREHTVIDPADVASTHHALTRSTHTLVVWLPGATLLLCSLRRSTRCAHGCAAVINCRAAPHECVHECRPGSMPTEHADGAFRRSMLADIWRTCRQSISTDMPTEHADRACRRTCRQSLRTTADFPYH